MLLKLLDLEDITQELKNKFYKWLIKLNWNTIAHFTLITKFTSNLGVGYSTKISDDLVKYLERTCPGTVGLKCWGHRHSPSSDTIW